MFGLDAGILERKEQLWKRVLEQWGSEQGSDCHVATSPRRDVSSRSAPYHLKYEWFRNQGIGRRTNGGTEFQSRRKGRRLRGSARASYCFSFSLDTRIMFFILNTFIVSFIMF